MLPTKKEVYTGLIHPAYSSYLPSCPVIHSYPFHSEPWDSWKTEWLSLIESNESKLISLEYNNFDTIPPGQFKAFFGFPGLSYQVDREKIQHYNSRIWLGELQLIKDIDIE